MGNQQIHLDQDANLKAANPCTKYLHSTSLLHQLSPIVDEPIQLLSLQSHVKIEGKKFHLKRNSLWIKFHLNRKNFQISVTFWTCIPKEFTYILSWVGCYYKLTGTPEENSFPFFSKIAYTIETSVVEQFFLMQPQPFCNRFQYKKKKNPQITTSHLSPSEQLSTDREAQDQHVDFVDSPSLCAKPETRSHICTEPHQHFWHNVFSSDSPGLWGKDYSIHLTVRKLRLRCKNMLGPMGFSNGGAEVRPLDQSLKVPPRWLHWVLPKEPVGYKSQ